MCITIDVSFDQNRSVVKYSCVFVTSKARSLLQNHELHMKQIYAECIKSRVPSLYFRLILPSLFIHSLFFPSKKERNQNKSKIKNVKIMFESSLKSYNQNNLFFLRIY